MAETITAAPCRASREATHPMRSMFVSRSSFEKPSPLDRCSRTSSPSSHSTRSPRRSSSGRTSSAIVVLPAPERPVNHRVKPAPAGARPRSGPVEEVRGNREVPPATSAASAASVIALLDQRCVDVDPALELVGAGPAACALLLARAHRPRARNAPDRRIAGVVQRVVGDLVHVDVGLDALCAPVDERLDLPDAVALAPLDAPCPLARRRLLAADAGDPSVVALEGALERLDLADVAAPVGLGLPQPVGGSDRTERPQP